MVTREDSLSLNRALEVCCVDGLELCVTNSRKLTQNSTFGWGEFDLPPKCPTHSSAHFRPRTILANKLLSNALEVELKLANKFIALLEINYGNQLRKRYLVATPPTPTVNPCLCRQSSPPKWSCLPFNSRRRTTVSKKMIILQNLIPFHLTMRVAYQPKNQRGLQSVQARKRPEHLLQAIDKSTYGDGAQSYRTPNAKR